jgi:phosphoglycolate phosphatase-like HAD superfamily hydrolase
MIKLVAFDWNGTLLSDTASAWKAGNELFEIYKLRHISLKEFRDTFTIPIREMWRALGFPTNVDFLKQSEIYHKLYEKQAAKARTRAGVKEALSWLNKKHIIRMIYSNHIAPDIVKQLLRLQIFEYFDEVLARPAGDHSHVNNRSKDQKLFEYCKRNNFKPHEVLTIGDSEEEIEIGKKFGYYTVAITGGYCSTGRLKKHKPDFLIHNLRELNSIVNKLNK